MKKDIGPNPIYSYFLNSCIKVQVPVSLLINKRRNVSVHGKLGGIIVVINKTNIS